MQREPHFARPISIFSRSRRLKPPNHSPRTSQPRESRALFSPPVRRTWEIQFGLMDPAPHRLQLECVATVNLPPRTHLFPPAAPSESEVSKRVLMQIGYGVGGEKYLP